MVNIEKLSKIMEMTSSLNENEQLSAIRKANKLVKESGMTWTSLLAKAREAHHVNRDDLGSMRGRNPFEGQSADEIIRNFREMYRKKHGKT